MRLLLPLLLLAPLVVAAQPRAGSCPVFPADNPWNVDISGYPVHPMSATWISSIDASSSKHTLHPDWGTIPQWGIPYIYVGAGQPLVPVTYDAYGAESDPGPMPIPPDAPIEGFDATSGDRHVLVVDTANCRLYELYAARRGPTQNGWIAESGAIFDLSANSYRPDGWTSADAAGLPIYPGLVRFDEVASGSIDHAVRFTVPRTQRGWIHPARHQAGSYDTTYPPMGARLRLRADYDIAATTGQARVILEALKKHGMILADNGSAWFITGTSDTRWDMDNLDQLRSVPGGAFEVVYTGPTKHSPEASGVPVAAPPRARVAGDIVEIACECSEVQLALFDPIGRMVRAPWSAAPEADGRVRIPLDALPRGISLMRVRAGEQVETILVRGGY